MFLNLNACNTTLTNKLSSTEVRQSSREYSLQFKMFSIKRDKFYNVFDEVKFMTYLRPPEVRGHEPLGMQQ
jgi:hypothetical protein